MSDGIELRDLQQTSTGRPQMPPRHPDAAPGTLGKAYRLAEEKAKAAVHLQEGVALLIRARFTLLAIPLLLFPRLLLFFAQVAPKAQTAAAAAGLDRDHYDSLTPLESFLCRIIGFGLIGLGLIILFALVPHYAPPASNPARTPILNVLVGLTSITAIISYNTASIGALGTVVGGGTGIVAIWGWWVVVFGNVRLKQRDSKVPKRLRKL